MWFKNLVGFDEISPENVRSKIIIDGKRLTSKVNGRSFHFGSLEVPTLEHLRNQSEATSLSKGNLQIKQIVGNVQQLHTLKENENALFQAASQFNLLEMVSPYITPSSGIDIYERDYTQGPACAIACGAGTIYRNYFVPLNGQPGQTSGHQINCLDLIERALENDKHLMWTMSNGYALPTQEGILKLNSLIHQMNEEEREKLKGLLKIGVQWNTEVTISESTQLVTQAYCSALPVAYSSIDAIYWENFARIILEATYEATLSVAKINALNTGCKKVFLTLVGGGAFGNYTSWILDSLEKALNKFSDCPLEVYIVSYGGINRNIEELIDRIK